jgi:hypothetical protein
MDSQSALRRPIRCNEFKLWGIRMKISILLVSVLNAANPNQVFKRFVQNDCTVTLQSETERYLTNQIMK